MNSDEFVLNGMRLARECAHKQANEANWFALKAHFELAGKNEGAKVSEYERVPTDRAVWATILLKHSDQLRVYSSYSAPAGDGFGDPNKGIMRTEYAFENAQWPLMGAETTWTIKRPSIQKFNESTKYWFCVRTEAQHQNS